MSFINCDSPEFWMRGTFSTKAARFQSEVNMLLSAFPTVEFAQRYGLVTEVAGSVRTASGAIRDFLVSVPAGYPYEPPAAFSVGWYCTGEHRYSDTEMCLWQRNQWSKSRTLAYTVAKTYTWIHKHDTLLAYGYWPGNEQKH